MRFGEGVPAGCPAPASPTRMTRRASTSARAAAARFPGRTAATTKAERGPASRQRRRSPTTTSGCARQAAPARAGASCAGAAATAARPPRRPRRRWLLCCSALLLCRRARPRSQRGSRRRRIAARTCSCRRPHAFVGGAHPELLRAAAERAASSASKLKAGNRPRRTAPPPADLQRQRCVKQLVVTRTHQASKRWEARVWRARVIDFWASGYFE